MLTMLTEEAAVIDADFVRTDKVTVIDVDYVH